jgi:DNA-binding response OmpR family regulator
MFDDDALIRHYLISRGILSERQISDAIDYALDRAVQLDGALVALGLVTFEQLGSYLADIHQMPYKPLLQKPPSPFCKKMLALDLVEKWTVFPLEFDPENDLVTIAISNPDQIRSFIRLEQKVFAHHRPSFCVASRAEIEAAIKTYYQKQPPGRETAPEVPHDFSILSVEDKCEAVKLREDDGRDDKPILLFEPDIDKGKSLRTLLRREGYRNVTLASSEREAARVLRSGIVQLLVVPDSLRNRVREWPSLLDKTVKRPRIVTYRSLAPLVLGQEQPYQAVSGALIALVGARVRERLADDPDRQRETVERARYAKLLALRLQCSSFQVDRIVLAAWLFEKDLFGPLLTPLAQVFDSTSLINESLGPPEARHMESQVLSIVLHLIEIKRRYPLIGSDIQALRSLLREKAAGQAPENMIETLLALMVDEAFISRIDRPAARVLIVDPDADRDAALALRLRNDGYDVTVVSTVKKALEIINKGAADCIIAETTLGDGNGMDLCKSMKNHPAFSALPFLFIAAAVDQRSMAEGLRAGADDYLPKPVDPEVVALKLHRLLLKKLGHDSRPGIKGSLAQMEVTDLVQILSSSQKSVKIKLTEGDTTGEVYLDRGEVVHAVLGSCAGETAFYRLMWFNKGDFEVVPCATFPDRTIAMTVMELLMEGARIDDEAGKTYERSPQEPR